MDCSEIKKKSIIEIFNEMDYEEKASNHNSKDRGDSSETGFSYEEDISNDLSGMMKNVKEPKSFDKALDAAVKAQKIWKDTTALQRGDSLHKIWQALKQNSNSIAKLKNEFLTLVDYFDFYTDLSIQTEQYKHWKPYGVVLVVLSKYSPYFVLGATVPAALATGCSVIVLTPKSTKFLPLYLQDRIQEADLPEGLFNVVEFDGVDVPVSQEINKVFFCGSYQSTQIFYTKSLAESFNFFCPNNTAAFILESCDLNAAVDKIVTETWGKNSAFAVTTVVVQECVQNIFLEKLKHRVEQLVLENINSSRFQDKIMSEKIKKKVSEALRAGATIELCTKYESEIEWSPTVLVNYQNQSADEDVPILKVLVCRTAKEGVTLLNNCRGSFGTSIWTEISSQALEISSALHCPNIWINCHGVFEAGVPLQLSHINGDGVLGGNDGLLEYMSFRISDPTQLYKLCVSKEEDKILNIDNTNTFTALMQQQAFKNWQQANRRKHLKDIMNALENNKDLSKDLSKEILSHFAHCGHIFSCTERNSSQQFFIIRSKIPIGVILLIVTASIDVSSLAQLITPAIALGNAVIVVLKENNPSLISLVKTFNSFLPKNILNVVIGINNGVQLASDPTIQAVWIYEESTFTGNYFKAIKSQCAKTLKHIWIIPSKMIICQRLFEKECLRTKIVWLTKVDQFP